MKFHFSLFLVVTLIYTFSCKNERISSYASVDLLHIDSNGFKNYIIKDSNDSYLFIDSQGIITKKNVDTVSKKGNRFEIDGKLVKDHIRLLVTPIDSVDHVHYFWHVRAGLGLKFVTKGNTPYVCMDLVDTALDGSMLFDRICMSDTLYTKFQGIHIDSSVYFNYITTRYHNNIDTSLQMVMDSSHNRSVRGWIDTFEYKFVSSISMNHSHHFELKYIGADSVEAIQHRTN